MKQGVAFVGAGVRCGLSSQDQVSSWHSIYVAVYIVRPLSLLSSFYKASLYCCLCRTASLATLRLGNMQSLLSTFSTVLPLCSVLLHDGGQLTLLVVVKLHPCSEL